MDGADGGFVGGVDGGDELVGGGGDEFVVDEEAGGEGEFAAVGGGEVDGEGLYVQYFVFLMVICFQCYLYCHGSSQLGAEVSNIRTTPFRSTICTKVNNFQGLAVSDAIYFSKWYELPCKDQRSMLFFLMRAQRPIIVKAAFLRANMTTFTSVMK